MPHDAPHDAPADAPAERNIAHSLQRAAERYGDRPAITLGDQVCIDYRGLAERVARIAGGLRRAGLEPGDRVALVLPNSVATLPALYAIWHAGLVAVPLQAQLPIDQLRRCLDRTGCRWCVVAPARAEQLAELASGDQVPELERVVALGSPAFAALANHAPVPVADTHGNAPAWLFHTSGTTGRPKAAVLTHDNLRALSAGYLQIEDTDDGATLIHITPMSHGSGMLALPHVIAGANHVIPRSGGFDPDEAIALIARWPRARVCIAPFMLSWLTAHAAACPERLANLETVVYGSAPASVADLERAADLLGPRLLQLYGMGEVPGSIAALSKRDHVAPERRRARLASAGRPMPGTEVRVIDDRGRDMPAGQLGEVVCRGPVVMRCYWRDGLATAAALRDGWLHTGDLGRLDDDGYLTLCGRLADVIETATGPVHPGDIERTLGEHPQVREAVVVAVAAAAAAAATDDAAATDAPRELVAFVCPTAGAQLSSEGLRALCTDRAASAAPDRFVFLDVLPRNYAGKVVRSALRDRLRG